MAYRSWQRQAKFRSQILFAAGVLIIITLHSLVDYPLRSMALACLAGVAGGMLATSKTVSSENDILDGRMKVESLA
jgi:VIT1/CCC1 family predicted Fe2+/Mn2+ transporter